MARIRNRHVRSGISIAATTALWLMPRLAAFWNANPSIAISQVVQDDGAPESVDLSIHYGNPALQEDETIILFRDSSSALGTPRFAELHEIESLGDLARIPLIHTRSDARDWTTWTEWFAHQGAPEPQGPAFFLNKYLVSLRAAEDHIGAVLGWEGILDRHLDSGSLVRLVPETMESPFPLSAHSRAGLRQCQAAGGLASGTCFDNVSDPDASANPAKTTTARGESPVAGARALFRH